MIGSRSPNLASFTQASLNLFARNGLHPAALQVVVTAIQYLSRLRKLGNISGQSVLDQLLYRTSSLDNQLFDFGLQFDSGYGKAAIPSKLPARSPTATFRKRSASASTLESCVAPVPTPPGLLLEFQYQIQFPMALGLH